jgi:putative ABC transport system permease protein
VVERLTRLPGVESAAAASGLPLLRMLGATFTIVGRPTAAADEARKMGGTTWRVTPAFLHTMGIPLWKGRDFNKSDTADSPPVAIVSHLLARTYWTNPADAVGALIVLNQEPAPRQFQIIGIAADIRVGARQEDGNWGQIYVAFPQANFPSYPQGAIDRRLDFWFAVRTESDPAAFSGAARSAIREVDPAAPVDRLQTMEDAVSASLGRWRSPMLLLSSLAAVALLLSAIGIYGVVAYTVTQRRHEIGVRIALGASRAQTLRLVMGGVLAPALSGIAVGIGAAQLLTRYIAFLFYGVAPSDVVTLVGVVVVLLSVAMAACYIPARRAAGMDPAVVLRSE